MATGSNTACPLCGKDAGEVLLTVDSAPTSCAKLFPTREAAAIAGGRRVEFVLCTACAHVCNAAYATQGTGPDSLYNEDYYCSFTASPQARKYQVALAKELDRLVGLRGKTVLDIGCGDGFFLNSLSRLGARAIGFEPSSTFDIADRQPGTQVFHEHFEFGSTQQLSSPIDVVVMRHVLEHIVSPREALGSLKKASFDGFYPRFLFLEVPNVRWLLNESLYFDFYNDHIHYFSELSLNRLLTSAGWLPFARIGPNGEFLRLVSLNSSYREAEPADPIDDQLSTDQEAIASAATRFRQGRARWGERLSEVIVGQRNEGKRVAVWGAGARGVSLLAGLGLPDETYEYVVDLDPNKHGKYLPMIREPIYPPERLRRNPVDCVLVTSYTYFDEICASLDWFRSAGGSVIRVYPTPEVV